MRDKALFNKNNFLKINKEEDFALCKKANANFLAVRAFHKQLSFSQMHFSHCNEPFPTNNVPNAFFQSSGPKPAGLII